MEGAINVLGFSKFRVFRSSIIEWTPTMYYVSDIGKIVLLGIEIPVPQVLRQVAVMVGREKLRSSKGEGWNCKQVGHSTAAVECPTKTRNDGKEWWKLSTEVVPQKIIISQRVDTAPRHAIAPWWKRS